MNSVELNISILYRGICAKTHLDVIVLRHKYFYDVDTIYIFH